MHFRKLDPPIPKGYRPPKPPCNITLLKGYNGVALQRTFVQFLIGSPFAIDFYNWISGTKNPDEHFYSTLGSVRFVNQGLVFTTVTQRFDQNM